MTPGDPIQRMQSLHELWFHTGTACNLNCPFCLEGSGPGDTRLERIKLEDIRHYLDAGVALGVARFGFTGGEPLIVKDIVRILQHALALRPCVLLTNGTAPLIKRAHQLQLLRQQPHPLTFHISIDCPDEARHDLGRGLGNFKKAFEGMKLLHDCGFPVGLTRQTEPGEDRGEVDTRFRLLFRKSRLPDDLPIHRLPELGALGKPAAAPAPALSLDRPMCSYSRMVIKRAGAMHVYACPFVDDDERFDQGPQLEAAVAAPVATIHHRCTVCASFGAECKLAR